jgi:hypothetical protein
MCPILLVGKLRTGDILRARQPHTRAGSGVVAIGIGMLLTVSFVTIFYHGGGKRHGETPPNLRLLQLNRLGPPQTIPLILLYRCLHLNRIVCPGAFVGREERDLGRGFAVDTSVEPYPNLHLDDIAERVFTTACSQWPDQLVIKMGEGTWKVKESGPAITHTHHRHTALPLDSLSRADLAKELIFSIRMLDKLSKLSKCTLSSVSRMAATAMLV